MLVLFGGDSADFELQRVECAEQLPHHVRCENAIWSLRVDIRKRRFIKSLGCIAPYSVRCQPEIQGFGAGCPEGVPNLVDLVFQFAGEQAGQSFFGSVGVTAATAASLASAASPASASDFAPRLTFDTATSPAITIS